MRQNPNSRRSRGRGGRKPGNSRNQIFDSNGPGARVRGNSAQIYEKYQQLARDASSSGDRIAAENFYQHAEHYYRLMEAAGLNRNGNAQDDAQQRNKDGNARNGEATAKPETEPATAEAPAASAEAPDNDGAASQDEAALSASGSGGNGKDPAKPGRRAGGRRGNGSANGRSAPDKDAEATASDDGAEARGEDSEPASA